MNREKIFHIMTGAAPTDIFLIDLDEATYSRAIESLKMVAKELTS